MFNQEQTAYMQYLASIPPEQKCWCGWSLLGECSNCRTYAPGKTTADRMEVWCPECHNDPGPNGLTTIIHRKGCSRNS